MDSKSGQSRRRSAVVTLVTVALATRVAGRYREGAKSVKSNPICRQE